MPAPAAPFPRRLVLAGALVCGMLLALAGHMIGQRFGLDMAALWSGEDSADVPALAAVGWWLNGTVAFAGGYLTAVLMGNAANGQISRPMRYLLAVVLIVLLAAAGQAATAPSGLPTVAGVLGGVLSLTVGALMAFCGAHFALRN